MSKTITLIELLNMIANGENVPEKIIHDNEIFRFDEESKIYKREKEPWLYLSVETKELNDTIEILDNEETTDIEELPEWGFDDDNIRDKINELIKAVNKHSKEIKEIKEEI